MADSYGDKLSETKEYPGVVSLCLLRVPVIRPKASSVIQATLSLSGSFCHLSLSDASRPLCCAWIPEYLMRSGKGKRISQLAAMADFRNMHINYPS